MVIGNFYNRFQFININYELGLLELQGSLYCIYYKLLF